jgi:hypothetical protein
MTHDEMIRMERRHVKACLAMALFRRRILEIIPESRRFFTCRREACVTPLGLHVVATNTPAIELYDRLGFTECTRNRFCVKETTFNRDTGNSQDATAIATSH